MQALRPSRTPVAPPRLGRRRLTAVAAAVAVLFLVTAVGASAFFTATGTGSGSATVGTLTSPGQPARTGSGASVDLSWTASTVTGGTTIGYHVERTPDPGSTWSSACGTSASSPTVSTSCTDSPAAGDYRYRVTAIAASWTAVGPESVVLTVAGSVVDHFTITPASSTRTAGTPFNVTVAAKSASGSTVSGYTGTIHFTSNDPQAVLPPDYTFTGANAGVQTFVGGVTLKTAGTGMTVEVADTGSATGSASYTVNPGAASQISVTGAVTDLTAGVARSLTATVKDAFGNTVTSGPDGSVSVSFGQSAGAGSLSGLGSVGCGRWGGDEECDGVVGGVGVGAGVGEPVGAGADVLGGADVQRGAWCCVAGCAVWRSDGFDGGVGAVVDGDGEGCVREHGDVWS